MSWVEHAGKSAYRQALRRGSDRVDMVPDRELDAVRFSVEITSWLDSRRLARVTLAKRDEMLRHVFNYFPHQSLDNRSP
jgi:hypothetical protein